MPFKLYSSAFLVALTCVGGGASATTLFSDDFDGNNRRNVPNWTELEAANNDVRRRDNAAQLQDNRPTAPDAALARLAISTFGFKDITVSFDWQALPNNEANDLLYFAWDAGTAPALTDIGAWTTVAGAGPFGNATANAPFVTETLSLGPQAANTTINLLFYTDVSPNNGGNTEGFNIDNVIVSGTPQAVPLPAGFGLLVAGLGALGIASRRKIVS
ncbi:MAG: VPLPA-CTERM sorting domain-containing protein [Pseudomonadota bacterium]